MAGGLVLGDLPAAIVAHLRADTDVNALCQGRISIAFPEGRRAWSMPDYAIIVRPAGGLRPSSYDDRRFGRCDLHFYGSGASPNTRRRTARLLWRTTEPALVPPPSTRRPMGFNAAGLIVYLVRPEMSEPLSVPEPGASLEHVVMPYTFTYAKWPVAA
jgi:hypothetical protein